MPWKKGQSGNPGGRRKEVAHVREAAREWTEEAIKTLAEIMIDPEQPAAARVQAADKLLDRGYGRAPQHVTADIVQTVQIDELTEEQLASVIATGEAPAGVSLQ